MSALSGMLETVLWYLEQTGRNQLHSFIAHAYVRGCQLYDYYCSRRSIDVLRKDDDRGNHRISAVL